MARPGLRATAGRLLVVLALALSGGPPALAQDAGPPRLPYDAELLRLAEIMGSLHYLSRLCDGASDWRDQMEALMEAEQPDVMRRARMIDRFNRGYESYRSVYRGCTDSAQLVVSRYMDEGARIAADIGQRYGYTEGE